MRAQKVTPSFERTVKTDGESRQSVPDAGGIAVRVTNLSKCYQIYDRPQDRLKQSLLPRLHRLAGLAPESYFREFWALSDVSFEIRKGETVGVIGRNGSGKSTLLQMICGTLSPTAGTVTTQGRVAALLELGAGFSSDFTGRENVYMNGAVLGLEKSEIDARFDAIAAFADIGDFIDQPVKTYSSGMFARLAFAVAANVDPEILVVDEILAVGDAAFQRKCMQRFYDLRDAGCTILLVAHDQYLVRSTCDRAIYLKAGRMIAFGEADEVAAHYNAELGLSRTSRPSCDRDTTSSGGSASPMAEKPGSLFQITEVQLLRDDGTQTNTVKCGETVRLRMNYEARTSELPSGVSFVFNLYTQDGLYVCGTTTLMEGMKPHEPGDRGEVIVTFEDLPLLQGKYVWRVAINDDGGLLVHAEAKGVCPFQVVDDFRSVGLVHLKRKWDIVAKK